MKRRVTFYEAVGRREDGTLARPDKPYDLGAAIHEIKGITPAERNVQQRDMLLDCDVVKGAGTEGLVVTRDRTEGGPAVKRRGQEGRGSVQIRQDEYLAEETHVAFFPKSVVGIMRAQGPTHTRVAQLLNQLVEFEPELAFATILAADVQQRLQRADQTYWAEIKLPVQSAGLISQNRGGRLRDVFTSVGRGYDQGAVATLRIQVPKQRARTEGQQLLKDVSTLVLDESLDVEKAEVKIKDDAEARAEEIDLLEEKLTQRVDVEARADAPYRLDDKSAIAALVKAHTQLERQIAQALDHPRWLSD
jgi:hypothetical protein